MQRMNDGARLERWQKKAAQFIIDLMADYDDGYFFLATRDAKTKKWKEHVFAVGGHGRAVRDHFANHHRDAYDHYFCVNSFSAPVRKAKHARSSNRAWVDIDNADPDKFDPQPNVLIETSPVRYQGIWIFHGWTNRHEAELYSKALAYNFGADKNGWSSTKYLRVPFTKNHKEEYRRPRVKLRQFDLSPQKRKPIPVPEEIWRTSNAPIIHVELRISKDWQKIYDQYRARLHPRVRFLIESDRAFAFEKDRSKCIYEIVADMAKVGAKPQEIASVLWHNPYFLSKHGPSIDALNAELWRILERLGVAYDV